MVWGPLTACVLVAGTATADGVERGALLASMCNACHGTDGQGSSTMPKLAGKEVEEIVDLLKAFASGEEPSTIMDRHASGYTDEEIRAIAEHYANL
jgi:sulfide dehydrogenase cytochrome subunit